MAGLPTTIRSVADKLRDLNFGPNLDEIQARAREKRKLAERFAQIRGDADALFQTAERLRFRLLLNRSPVDRGRGRAPEALAPFYVLTSHDWTKLDHILELLDAPRLERLRIEVNELLFLWIATRRVAVFGTRSRGQGRRIGKRRSRSSSRFCDMALAFADAKEPWRARGRLERSRNARDVCRIGHGRDEPLFEGEPHEIGEEKSALASFQWALLCLRNDRKPGDPMDAPCRPARAGQLLVSVLLAYVEDQDGSMDEALESLRHRAGPQAEEPWVRFSRADSTAPRALGRPSRT